MYFHKYLTGIIKDGVICDLESVIASFLNNHVLN